MSGLWHDLRAGVKRLGKQPAFTALAVCTLALGIGANTAIFSVVQGVLLRPLPYRQPDRLVAVFSQFTGLGFDRFWLSAPEYRELGERLKGFASLGAYVNRPVNLTGREEPVRVDATFATASLFSTLGVPPVLGRLYSEAEDRPGGPPVVLLGYDVWQRAFGGDPGILGRRVSVDGAPRTVVGVTRPGFGIGKIGGRATGVWLPLALGAPKPEDRARHLLSVVGRLRPGTPLAAARAELSGLLARWPREMPDVHTPNARDHRLFFEPLLDQVVAGTRPALRLLVAAVGVLLLIACGNVANLLLVRAEGRQREIAVRIAVGADRLGLLRQLLTESLLLSLAGGALGLVFASWGLSAVLHAGPGSLPRVDQIGLDPQVLAYALLVSLVSGLLFGLAPGLQAWAGKAVAVAEGNSRTTGDVRRQRLRRGLVVAEIALAAALVLGGGLLLRSFWRLRQVDPGFRPGGVLSLQISLPEATYSKADRVVGFYRDLVARLAALPGVESATAATGLPPETEVTASDVEVEGLPQEAGGAPRNVDYWQFTTPDYFRTLGIPLLSGRAFDGRDSATSPPVAVISETLARAFWKGGSPLGRRLRPAGADNPWVTVVGVAGDVKQGGLGEKAGTAIYLLHSQTPAAFGDPPRTLYALVRTPGDPRLLTGAVRDEVRRLDPALPVAQVRPLAEVVSGSIAQPRFVTLLVAAFALIALCLAAVGIYGVLAYTVEGRVREIGVRMALGAEVTSVLRMVLAQGMRWVFLGLALGLVAALAARRVLASLLFGITASDPLTFLAVTALLVGVSLLACYLPARRAARVEPMVSLRHE